MMSNRPRDTQLRHVISVGSIWPRHVKPVSTPNCGATSIILQNQNTESMSLGSYLPLTLSGTETAVTFLAITPKAPQHATYIRPQDTARNGKMVAAHSISVTH